MTTSWHDQFGSANFTFFAGPHYKACNARAMCMDQLCLDPGREIFDEYFILVYPWWLQNEAIKTSIGPLKHKFCPFLGHPKLHLVKIYQFSIFPTKFNLILATKAPTKINLVPMRSWDCSKWEKKQNKRLIVMLRYHKTPQNDLLLPFLWKITPKINLNSSTQCLRDLVLVPKVVFWAVDLH